METTTRDRPQQDSAKNPFGSAMVASRAGGLISVEQQRAIAEVQAAMLVARSMPRDRKAALDLVLQDCTDPELAEEAEYEYSRGGSKISGPSIRLLETVARRWGNMESGIQEVARNDGYSEFKAFAVDLETGFRDSKVFHVKHWRDTSKGGYQLTDERDIYELGANMGARRKRACMEAVIPSDVIRQAQNQCQVTLKTKVEITPELIDDMLGKFADYGVTKDMIEKRIQRHITAMTPGLAVQLRRIYNSLKDGMAQPADFFEVAAAAAAADAKPATGAAALNQAAKDRKKPQAPTGGELLADVQKLCDRVKAAKDKEAASLLLDDAKDLARALDGEQKVAADAAIKDASAALGGQTKLV